MIICRLLFELLLLLYQLNHYRLTSDMNKAFSPTNLSFLPISRNGCVCVCEKIPVDLQFLTKYIHSHLINLCFFSNAQFEFEQIFLTTLSCLKALSWTDWRFVLTSTWTVPNKVAGGNIKCTSEILISVLNISPLFSAIRYCDRCQLIKPDRCHHCSTCDKWVHSENMDILF